MEREKVRWRGTHGVGDFMHALNVVHQYGFEKNKIIDLEMHWEHDEDYLYHPDDPETIIERMEWMHGKYYLSNNVKITHQFNSDLFSYKGDENHRNKVRFQFESENLHPIIDQAPPNQWCFDPREYTTPENRIVIWTPYYNREQPRRWKRWFEPDDWEKLIINLESWEGWQVIELTYRTPIREAYNQIRRAKYVVSYDGMWHYISKNFCKPHVIPSKEGITSYNTPNAVRIEDTEIMHRFFSEEQQADKLGYAKERANKAKQKVCRDLGIELR